MRVFRLLGLRRLRLQPLRALVAVLAVGAGVSMAVSILVVTTSTEQSVQDFGRTLALPASLRIVGASDRGGVTAAALGVAARVAGVKAVVPMVQAVTFVDRLPSEGGRPVPARDSYNAVALGVDCRAQALFGRFGCSGAALAAVGDRPLFVSPQVRAAVGPTGSLRTDLGRVTLASVPVASKLSALHAGRIVVFSLAGAQARFSRPRGVDLAYVVARPGVDIGALQRRLQVAVGAQNRVLTADDPPPLVSLSLAGVLPLFDLLGVFGLAAAIVLAANSVTLSLEERRRQLAVLGALGARSSTVVGGAVGEAVILGGLGGVVGTLGGAVLAGPILSGLAGYVEPIVGIPLVRHVAPWVAVLGVVLGAAVGGLSAWFPARRAMRLDVVAELSGRRQVEEATPPRIRMRFAASAVVLAVGVGLCIAAGSGGGIERWQGTAAPVGFLIACISGLVFSANLAPLVIGWLARRLRGSRRGTVVLALANLVRDPRRTGILAVAIAAPITVGFMTGGVLRSARTNITNSVRASGRFVALSTYQPGGGFDSYVPPAVIYSIEHLPEVGAVRRSASVVSGADGGQIVGISGLSHPPSAGELQMLQGRYEPSRFASGDVLIGGALARSTGTRAGGSVAVDTPIGRIHLPVMGVVSEGNFGGHGLEMSYRRMVGIFGPVPSDQLWVVPRAGVSDARLAAAVRRTGAALEPTLQVRTPSQTITRSAATVKSQLASFAALQKGLELLAFIAVFSNLLLVGMQRTAENGLLGAVGATPAAIRRLVVGEVGLLGALAALQAAVIGPIMLGAMISVLPVLLGFRDPMRMDWGSFVVAAAIAVGVAVLGSLLPADRAARMPVLDALRYE